MAAVSCELKGSGAPTIGSIATPTAVGIFIRGLLLATDGAPRKGCGKGPQLASMVVKSATMSVTRCVCDGLGFM